MIPRDPNICSFIEAQHHGFLSRGDMTGRHLRHARNFVICFVLAFPGSPWLRAARLKSDLSFDRSEGLGTIQATLRPLGIYSADSTPAAYFSVEFSCRRTTTWTCVSGIPDLGEPLRLAKPGSSPQSASPALLIVDQGEMQRSPGSSEMTRALYRRQSGISLLIACSWTQTRADLFSKNLPDWTPCSAARLRPLRLPLRFRRFRSSAYGGNSTGSSHSLGSSNSPPWFQQFDSPAVHANRSGHAQ